MLTPLVTGIFTPLVGIPLIGPGLLNGVNGIVTGAVTGQTISLDVLDFATHAVIDPAAPCATTSDSFQLDTPAGIAIGGNSITGLGSGTAASAGALSSIAFGNGASNSAGVANAVALGSGATVTTANSLALGTNSRADRGALTGYTAPGLATPQNSVGEFSVGTPGNARQITNVAAGSQPTDAANVGQLTGAVATSAAAAALQYSNALTPTTPNGGTRTNDATLVGAAGAVALHNVAPGALAAGSTDAVNGGQLFATNGQVTTNTTNIAGNTANITNLSTGINGGTVGLVRQVGGAPGVGQITVGAATGGTSLSVAGTGGNRVVSGVAAGLVATDAVNLSQLNAVGAGSANAVLYDTAGGVRQNRISLAGGLPGPVTIGNVAPGALNGTSTEAVNGAQLFATNGQVTTNTTNTAGNTTAITNINNGTTGIVRQVGGAPGVGTVTVGAQTGGTLVSIAGTGGTRTLSGVTAAVLGAGSTSAVNGSQLFATNNQVATNTGNIATNTSKITTNTNNIATNTTDIGNLSTGIDNGTLGLVQQVGGAPGIGLITVGAGTGGGNISVAGTDGDRVVSGVAAGLVATDAVNLSQLTAVGAGSANAVLYDTLAGVRQNSITLSGGLPGPVALHNVAPGAVDALSTDAVNGAQLSATNGLVDINTTTIANIGGVVTTLNTNVTTLQNDALLYDSGLGAFSAVHGGANQRITNLAPGALGATSSDAVNGAQLFGLGNQRRHFARRHLELQPADRAGDGRHQLPRQFV